MEKYLNETHGPHDGGDASPMASPIPGVESSAAGVARNARGDRVDQEFLNSRCVG